MKDYFFHSTYSTIRDTAKELNFSKSSVHRNIRYNTKMYPYRNHKVNNLSDAPNEQRIVFYEWLVKELKNLRILSKE